MSRQARGGWVMISSDRIARLPEFGERARGSVWALSRFPLVNYLLVAPRARA